MGWSLLHRAAGNNESQTEPYPSVWSSKSKRSLIATHGPKTKSAYCWFLSHSIQKAQIKQRSDGDYLITFAPGTKDTAGYINLSDSEQSCSAFALHNSYKETAATTMSSLLLRASGVKENAIFYHLTNTQCIVGSFALILIIIFATAALLDYRWSKAASPRDLSTNHKPNSFLQS
jgi:hypothetical protein